MESRRGRGIEAYRNFGCSPLRDMTGVGSVFFSTYKGFSPPESVAQFEADESNTPKLYCSGG